MGERLARGAALLSFGSLTSLLLSAAGSIVVARALGPEQYGLVTVAMVMPNLLMAILDFGITAALTRYASMGRFDVVSTAVALRILIAAAAGLVNFLLAPVFSFLVGRPEISDLVRLLSLFTTTFLLFSAANYMLVGMGRYAESVLANVLFTSLKVLVAVALVLNGYGLFGALVAHVIAGLLVHIPMFLRAVLLLGGLRFSPPSARELFAYGIPLYLTYLLHTPLGQVYYSFMVSVSSNEEVSNLSVAYALLTPLNALGTALAASFFSVLPSLTSREEVERTVRGALRVTSLFLPSLSLGLVILSQPLVALLFGEGYRLAPLFLSAYLLLYLLAPLGSLVWYSYFASLGKTSLILRAFVVQNLVGAPLYFGLTYTAGVLGYISAIVISHSVFALYLLRSVDFPVEIKDNLKAMSPSLLSFTASLPPLLFLKGMLGWALAASLYAMILSLTVPILAGEEALEGLSKTFARVRVLGPFLSLLTSLDVAIASKIWGVKEEGRS